MNHNIHVMDDNIQRDDREKDKSNKNELKLDLTKNISEKDGLNMVVNAFFNTYEK